MAFAKFACNDDEQKPEVGNARKAYSGALMSGGEFGVSVGLSLTLSDRRAMRACRPDIGAIVLDIDLDNANLASSALDELRSIEDPTTLPDIGSLDSVRLDARDAGVGKLICLGLNERTHSREIRVPLGVVLR